MRVFDYREVDPVVAEEGASRLNLRWLITKDMGADNFAMRLFEMAPGGFSPLHTHPWEHEVFVLEGKGAVTGGEAEKPFKAGTVVFISAGERHQFRNTGDETVRFLCMIPYEKS